MIHVLLQCHVKRTRNYSTRTARVVHIFSKVEVDCSRKRSANVSDIILEIDFYSLCTYLETQTGREWRLGEKMNTGEQAKLGLYRVAGG